MIRRRMLAEQTAAHLVEEMSRGRWCGVLPGVNRLAVDLGVSRETMRAALKQVEEMGLLSSPGDGRARVIVAVDVPTSKKRGLRVAILLRESLDEEVNSNFLRMVLRIRYRIEEAGHVCLLVPKSQVELGLHPAKIIRMVEQIKADAWLVAAGSHKVLEWFAAQSVPVLAIGGSLKALPIAGASRDPLPAFQTVIQELIAMGHRRITLISSSERRHPSLSATELMLKDVFAAHKIPFGNYNIPEWNGTHEALEKLLTSIFLITPPTTILVSTPQETVGVLAFLSRHGYRVPEDVSIICKSMDQTLSWHQPEIAHFTTDFEMILKRVLQWVNSVAQGNPDLRKIRCFTTFHPGGSIMKPTTDAYPLNRKGR